LHVQNASGRWGWPLKQMNISPLTVILASALATQTDARGQFERLKCVAGWRWLIGVTLAPMEMTTTSVDSDVAAGSIDTLLLTRASYPPRATPARRVQLR
jgi:hypothetical protein